LQREYLLALSRTGRDPVRDRSAQQGVDRRLIARNERQIRALDVARDQPRALQRTADALRDPLHQTLEIRRARGRHGHEPQDSREAREASASSGCVFLLTASALA
jgi:hypothetical protein